MLNKFRHDRQSEVEIQAYQPKYSVSVGATP
jgi:hypothetical protein